MIASYIVDLTPSPSSLSSLGQKLRSGNSKSALPDLSSSKIDRVLVAHYLLRQARMAHKAQPTCHTCKLKGSSIRHVVIIRLMKSPDMRSPQFLCPSESLLIGSEIPTPGPDEQVSALEANSSLRRMILNSEETRINSEERVLSVLVVGYSFG